MALVVPGCSPTLAAMLAVVRQDLFDTDTSNPTLSDAEITNELNVVFVAWWEAFNNRDQRLMGSDAWQSINAQSAAGLTSTSPLSNLATLEWKQLFYDGPTTTANRYGVPLEILSVQDVILLQQQMGQGTPAYAAVARLQGTDQSSNGRWGLYLAPMPVVTCYVSALVRGSAYVFPVGGTTQDLLDCTNAEALTVAHATAAGLAERQGMPEGIIDSCWKLAGNQMQQLLKNKKRSEPEGRQKVNAA